MILSLPARAAVAAVGSLASLAFMDCQPSLYLADIVRRWMPPQPSNPSGVWIIGASSGLGRKLALELASDGKTQNIILSSRRFVHLREVAEECRRINPTCNLSVFPFDLRMFTENMNSTYNIRDVCSQVSTVVLNAGQGHLSPALETDGNTAKSMMMVNALGYMMLAPEIMRSGVNHFVVTSSIAGKLPLPLSASYAASKHALHGYFASLAAENNQLRVDMICPGSIDTNFHPSPSSNASTATKMTVERCAKLMMTAMMTRRSSGYKEFVIATQPTLLFLYFFHFFPCLAHKALAAIGNRRVKMYKAGLDLYDQRSWLRRL